MTGNANGMSTGLSTYIRLHILLVLHFLVVILFKIAEGKRENI